MKTISQDQFAKFSVASSANNDDIEGIEDLSKTREEWTEWDILSLPYYDLSDENKLMIFLLSDLVDKKILHEFACRCAEQALLFLKNPDPYYKEIIAKKRAWIKGEISEEELKAARRKYRNGAGNVSECVEMIIGEATDTTDRCAFCTAEWLMTLHVFALGRTRETHIWEIMEHDCPVLLTMLISLLDGDYL